MSLLPNESGSDVSISESSSSFWDKEPLEIVVFTFGLYVAVMVSIFVSYSRFFRTWCHESLAVLFIGVIVGGFAFAFPSLSSLLEVFTPNTFSKIFYEILFPPVIFNAGFTLKQRHFMRNIGSISTYAVFGTIISCIILSMSLYGINLAAHFADLDFIECIMFGALLSATDAVSTIAVLLELNVIPMLYSLVFGESVLNDAVAIALCSALEPYVGRDPQAQTIGFVVRDFIVIVLGSVGIGAAVGLFSAFVAAREKDMNLSTTFQMMQILVLAYFSYVLAEYCEISGVISLFVCALTQSHYCWHSVSEPSRRALFQVSGALDYLSEMMVFLSFGILLLSRENLVPENWNPWFILVTMVILFIARAVNVFGLSFLLNLGRKEKIPFKIQFLLWWCGMRGIVTLLLVLNFHTPNRYMLINTTFVVVFFTNIVIGIVTRPIVIKLDVKSKEAAANQQDPGHTLPPEYITRAQLNERSKFARWWFLIDNKFLKKAFGGRARIILDDDDVFVRSGEHAANPEGAEEDKSSPRVSTDESDGGSKKYSELDVAETSVDVSRMGEQTGFGSKERKVVSTSTERALAMPIEEEVLKSDENSVPIASVRHYGTNHYGGSASTSPGADGGNGSGAFL